MKQGRPSLVRLGPSNRERKPDIRISLGCRLDFEFPKSTPVIAMLNVDDTRYGDLELLDYLTTSPCVPIESYRDGFGNWCSRLTAPPGAFTLATHGIFLDSGKKIRFFRPPISMSWKISRPIRSCFYWGAGTAIQICCQRKRGGCLERHRLAGPGCRRFVTTCTSMWSSAMSMRGRPARRPRHWPKGGACAVTSRIWRSLSAGA
jgi:hypothetical protein